MTASTLSLIGWTLVQTWHESHGTFTQETYQKEQTESWRPRRVECLVISTYRDKSASTVRLEDRHDYLMARDIRADAARYVQTGQHTEACCTAGHEDFKDAETGQRWRIAGAAGHGEWAFKLTDADA